MTTSEKVKVAVINTGIDMSHFVPKEACGRVKQVKSWVKAEDAGDSHGAGTHAAALILKVAPAAEIYVARIAVDPSTMIDPNHFAEVVCRQPNFRTNY